MHSMYVVLRWFIVVPTNGPRTLKPALEGGYINQLDSTALPFLSIFFFIISFFQQGLSLAKSRIKK